MSIRTHSGQGFDFNYDFEWPKTHADITWLLGLKNFNLRMITAYYKIVKNQQIFEGISIQFEG